MKNIRLLIIPAICSMLLFSCQNEEKTGGGHSGSGELSFSAAVDDMVTVLASKAIGNTFFEEGNGIDVTIVENRPGATGVHYTYVYGNDGIFRGSPGYRFALNDNYIKTLTAIWPTEEVRKEGIKTDQRLLENYRLADWLTATASATGVMPSDAPVPLTFERENTMLDFEIVGQNAGGLDIESLVLELIIDGVKTACWAYCGNPNGHAELILEQGSELDVSDGYLIGRLTVASGDVYLIIFPQTSITFEKGTRYLITLTPSGYDLSMYASIVGWYQDENGIAIPFQKPDPIEGGSFMVSTPQQLIGMSYLIRHYDNPLSFDWANRTYIIDPALDINEYVIDNYIPIPKSDFSGEILLNGQQIDYIGYGEGQFLELIDNNN